MKVCSCSPQRHNNSILSFLAPPYQPAKAKALLDKLPWEERCRGTLLLPPPLQTLLPFPDQLPLTALYRHAVEQVCDRRCNKWHRTGWLLARAGCFPLLQSHVLWYMCFCAEVFLSVLTLYSQMEHSLGVNFFFLLPLLM